MDANTATLVEKSTRIFGSKHLGLTIQYIYIIVMIKGIWIALLYGPHYDMCRLTPVSERIRPHTLPEPDTTQVSQRGNSLA